jgi:hypothetical protein
VSQEKKSKGKEIRMGGDNDFTQGVFVHEQGESKKEKSEFV